MHRALFVVCLLMLTALPAQAGSIGPMGSYIDPQDTTDDNGGGVKISFDMGRNWNLEVRGAWFDFLGQNEQGRRFKLDAVPIDFGLSYDFLPDGRVHPYLGAGGTYYVLDGDVIDKDPNELTQERVDDEFGFYLVAGLEFDATQRIALFIEVLDRHVEAEFRVSGIIPRFNRFKSDLAGTGVNGGVLLRW